MTSTTSKRVKPWHVLAVLVLMACALAAADGIRSVTAVGTADANQLRSEAPAPAPLMPKPKLVVAFRLDPELTRGLFMGDRWVTPPTYFFAQQGPRFVVHAKPQQLDRRGETIDLSGDWSVDNPSMVAVTPGPKGEVTLVVREPGQAQVTVATASGSKALRVSAKQVDGGMQVRITQ